MQAETGTVRPGEGHEDVRALGQVAVAVTGASGLIGTALCRRLEAGGARVVRLVRRAPRGPEEIEWDPARGVVDRGALQGVDAVVHLAGENIGASVWWSRARRRALYDSRVGGTRVLCRSLTALKRPPRVFLCASAVGYYGDRGDEILDETSPPGRGFLPDLCVAWEAQAKEAAAAGARVVCLRFGIIVTAEGGMVGRVLMPFRLGLGGPLGRGDQWISWVALDDAISVMALALRTEELSGPINVVSPEPVTNLEFTKALGRVLHRPTVLRVPATLLRLALGSFAREALLASTRCRPGVLARVGYEFQFPDLEAALRQELLPLAHGP